MPRQLINLIGIVVIAGLLAAGAMLVVLPGVGSARATEAGARDVAQTNELYRLRVEELSAAQERIDELSADVAALRGGIPASSRLDDVMQIVVEAAEATGATIEGVAAAELEAWTPRAGLGGAEGSETAPADDAATDATAETPDGGAAGDPTAAAEETAAPTETTTDAAASPQRQIPVTITVAVESADVAAAFIDALGRGPRLLLPIDGTLDETTLTVTALALVRTED